MPNKWKASHRNWCGCHQKSYTKYYVACFLPFLSGCSQRADTDPTKCFFACWQRLHLTFFYFFLFDFKKWNFDPKTLDGFDLNKSRSDETLHGTAFRFLLYSKRTRGDLEHIRQYSRSGQALGGFFWTANYFYFSRRNKLFSEFLPTNRTFNTNWNLFLTQSERIIVVSAIWGYISNWKRFKALKRIFLKRTQGLLCNQIMFAWLPTKAK